MYRMMDVRRIASIIQITMIFIPNLYYALYPILSTFSNRIGVIRKPVITTIPNNTTASNTYTITLTKRVRYPTYSRLFRITN